MCLASVPNSTIESMNDYTMLNILMQVEMVAEDAQCTYVRCSTDLRNE